VSRAYDSKLREEQAAATRLRVVEAVTAVLGRGISELTYPAVAQEAGVSLATVQRLFPRKRDLVAGLAEHYNRTIGNLFAPHTPPEALDFDGLLHEVRAVVERTSRVPSGLRAAVASEEYRLHRKGTRARRVALMEKVLKPHAHRLSGPELRHLRNLMVVLVSSAGVTAFEDLAGANASDASEAVAWMLRRLLNRPE
jgi:AcrR family transcriptional regulator